MGSFAPERVLTTDPVSAGAAPYPVIANPDTLIGATDLVFIDAPGAGYSRLLGDATGTDFYGVDADVAAFTKAISRYITKYKRWDDLCQRENRGRDGATAAADVGERALCRVGTR
jgi:carboxypeptidase C (cathepsin A)